MSGNFKVRENDESVKEKFLDYLYSLSRVGSTFLAQQSLGDNCFKLCLLNIRHILNRLKILPKCVREFNFLSSAATLNRDKLKSISSLFQINQIILLVNICSRLFPFCRPSSYYLPYHEVKFCFVNCK